jgi:hypothetical protein
VPYPPKLQIFIQKGTIINLSAIEKAFPFNHSCRFAWVQTVAFFQGEIGPSNEKFQGEVGPSNAIILDFTNISMFVSLGDCHGQADYVKK